MLNKEVLKEIADRFDKSKIVWGLGGSCTMCLQGIEVDPHDFDLFVIEQDFDAALHLLSHDGTFTQQGPEGIFASLRYAHGMFMGSPVDLIAGFRIVTPEKTTEYAFESDHIKMVPFEDIMIPCCLLEDWIVLYEAMGKQVKAYMIRSKLSIHN